MTPLSANIICAGRRVGLISQWKGKTISSTPKACPESGADLRGLPKEASQTPAEMLEVSVIDMKPQYLVNDRREVG